MIDSTTPANENADRTAGRPSTLSTWNPASTGALLAAMALLAAEGWRHSVPEPEPTSDPDSEHRAAAPDGARGPDELPLFFLAVHCDPQLADQPRWNALVDLEAAAGARNIRLSIQLTPQWAEMVAADPAKGALLQQWRDAGHEIAGHHHHLGHVYWDGYSNEPIARSLPEYLGPMDLWRDTVEGVTGAGMLDVLSSPSEVDWPAGILIRTGGGFGMGGAGEPTSVPFVMDVGVHPVWTIRHAALYSATQFNGPLLQALHSRATGDLVFGIASHPHNYDTPLERSQTDGFMDFIAAQDPDGLRNRTPGEIIAERTLRADLSGDFLVDGADLGVLLAAWGSGNAWCDLDGNGIVDGADLGELLGAWSAVDRD